MHLQKIWLATLTRRGVRSGTNSRVLLTIAQGGMTVLAHEFEDTPQSDQEAGQANLYELDVASASIAPELLGDASVRIGISGSDAWRPEHIVVWGERSAPSGTEVIPLAAEMNLQIQLSTDGSEGPSNTPLRGLNPGGRQMNVNRLLLFTVTQGLPSGGFGGPVQPTFDSDSPLEIQVVRAGQLVVLTEIRATHQADLEFGAANFYSAPVIAAFTKAELNSGSITLRVKGLDDWQPRSLFLFGVDAGSGQPQAMTSLVHLPKWPFGMLTPDNTTGAVSINLPLSEDPPNSFFPTDRLGTNP